MTYSELRSPFQAIIFGFTLQDAQQPKCSFSRGSWGCKHLQYDLQWWARVKHYAAGKIKQTLGSAMYLSRHKPCIWLFRIFIFLRLVEVYKTCITTKFSGEQKLFDWAMIFSFSPLLWVSKHWGNDSTKHMCDWCSGLWPDLTMLGQRLRSRQMSQVSHHHQQKC